MCKKTVVYLIFCLLILLQSVVFAYETVDVVVRTIWAVDIDNVTYSISDSSIARVISSGRRNSLKFIQAGDVKIVAHIPTDGGTYDYEYLIHVHPSDGQAQLNNSQQHSGRGNMFGDKMNNPNFAEEVLHLVNAERAKVGSRPLRLAVDLQRGAAIRAKEISVKFSHERPDGTHCHTVIGTATNIGENIAAGNDTPNDVVDSWMHSPGHKRNILDPRYRELGVGYYYDENAEYCHYWVQLFRL